MITNDDAKADAGEPRLVMRRLPAFSVALLLAAICSGGQARAGGGTGGGGAAGGADNAMSAGSVGTSGTKGGGGGGGGYGAVITGSGRA